MTLSRHVQEDHRNSVRAARAAGVPDDLIMLAHAVGEDDVARCGDRPEQQGMTTLNPSDNILAVGHYAENGWTVEDLTRVLSAYQRVGHRSLIAADVFSDLDAAIRRGPNLSGVYPHTARRWLDSHDWVGEYVRYIEAGHYTWADHMVRTRIAYRYGQHLVGARHAGPDRWIDLVDVALLREDGTEPEVALDHLLPYLYDPRVKSASVFVLYLWVKAHGVERAVLTGLAGLSKDEGLGFSGDLDDLRALAGLRA